MGMLSVVSPDAVSTASAGLPASSEGAAGAGSFSPEGSTAGGSAAGASCFGSSAGAGAVDSSGASGSGSATTSTVVDSSSAPTIASSLMSEALSAKTVKPLRLRIIMTESTNASNLFTVCFIFLLPSCDYLETCFVAAMWG